ncbi:MAG: hypothetical protein R2788_07620 [Saprospiraceae bacterium]
MPIRVKDKCGKIITINGSLTYLNCKIVNRIASGNTVIDHEELTLKGKRTRREIGSNGWSNKYTEKYRKFISQA